MNIRKTYPPAPKKKIRRAEIIKAARWPFLLAALCCVFLDFLSGHLDWSLIVAAALYAVWTVIVSPDLVEVNVISIMIKTAAWACVILFAVAKAAAWEGAWDVVSIICSSAMIVAFVLFLSDFSDQRHNTFPMMVLCIVTLSFSIPSFIGRVGAGRWFYGVSGIIAAAVLTVSLIILGGSFFRELGKRLHTK